VDDFLKIMAVVLFVCLSGVAWALWYLRQRDSKRDK